MWLSAINAMVLALDDDITSGSGRFKLWYTIPPIYMMTLGKVMSLPGTMGTHILTDRSRGTERHAIPRFMDKQSGYV